MLTQDRVKTSAKVTIIAPQSGSSAYFGTVVVNGIRLALKLDGEHLDVNTFDDLSDPAAAVRFVDIANSSETVAIIGPLDSNVTAAAANEAKRLKIPLISPCATATYLTTEDNPWFFRANTSDRQRAEEIASWAIELIGRKGVLIVHEIRSPDQVKNGSAPLYGEAFAADLQNAFDSEREPVGDVGFQRGGFNDVTRQAIVDRLQTGAVGAVAILTLDEEAVPIAEFVRNRFPGLPIFTSISGRDLFVHSRVKNNVYTVTATVVEDTKDSALEDFRRQYALAYPGQPTPTQQCAAYGYDAAQILVAAIGKAAQTIPMSKITAFRRGVRDALAATPNDRQGLMSVGGFTRQRELNFRPHRLVLSEGMWTEEGATSPHQAELPPARIAMYFAVLLVFLGSLVGLLVWQLPKLHSFGDRTVVFVISAIVGLVAALVTFGALRSYGQVSGESLGIAFQFGGPAALFVFVLVLGTRTSKRTPFRVTVIMHEDANARGVVAVNGTLALLLPKGQRQGKIKDGQAVFEALDAEYRNTSADYVLTINGYAALADSPQLRLTPDSVLYVRIHKVSEISVAAARQKVDEIQKV